VTSQAEPEPPAWRNTAGLTLRRVRAQAILLALCLWGVCAVDFATPGIFDRAGNIKFQDFLPLYVSARLIADGRATELYNQQVTANEMQSIVSQSNLVTLPNLYGPQVGILFVPLSRLSFPAAARIWVTLSLLIYVASIYLIWRECPELRRHAGIVAISAAAFPPLFHFFVRGQISVLPLVCFTATFLALRRQREWLAGAALGLLVLKPQFLVAIPFVLLLARAWKAFGGLTLSAAAQLIFTNFYFGPEVMRLYLDTLWHAPRWITAVELSLAPIQMHSLRSFWSLLVPWPQVGFALYIITSCVAVVIASVIWKSSEHLALRFSALTLAAVLVNPHLFVYDLLVLAPVLLLLVDWTLTHPQQSTSATFRLLLYLSFLLPMLGPLSQWTHLQVSVPIFVALLWTLRPTETAGHKLDSNECRVV
jgi:hypothetical protein